MIMPMDMKSMLRNPAVKRAWILERVSENPRVCKNCAGEGYLHLTIATAGPFENSPTGFGTAHWDNGWWKAETFSFLCPVCNNEPTIPGRVVDLNEPPEEPEKGYVQGDYTNI
jgi:hypothetical protein